MCVCVCVCAYILREERDNILRGLPQVSGDMLFSHNFDVGQVLDFFKLRVSRCIHVLTARFWLTYYFKIVVYSRISGHIHSVGSQECITLS